MAIWWAKSRQIELDQKQQNKPKCIKKIMTSRARGLNPRSALITSCIPSRYYDSASSTL